MSGICGFTGNMDKIVLEKMCERISHRTPDCANFFISDKISLGLNAVQNESYTIVLDGEQPDALYLLSLYEEHGEEMLNHLRGMFAFLIYDHKNDEIFAARDFFGIKPFYYGVLNGEFIFSSEIKAFLEYPDFKKKINHSALEHYLSFQYSVTDETFFACIYKLPPAHFIKYKDRKATIKRYWQADYFPQNISLEEIEEQIDTAVKNSISKHNCGENTGALLSGGVDSSYVAAVAASQNKIQKTFTVGFSHQGFDETERAKSLSKELGIENINKIISAEEFWESLGKIQYHMDEPLADPAAIALYFVCKLAREHVDTVFSGEGADEFFGGYGIYREPLSLLPITRLPMPIRRFLGLIAKKIPFNIKGKNYFIRASKTVEERFIGNANIFSKEERDEILNTNEDSMYVNALPPQAITRYYYEKAQHHDDITKMQLLDIHLWLPGDILLCADKMAMANSLKSRFPLIDKEVFAVAAKIPTKYRVNKKNGKYAFRLAAKRNFKDKTEKKRLGFPVPIRFWLREEKYYNIVRDAFTQKFMKEFFNTDKLLQLLERHKLGKEDNSRKIWTVFMFAVWYNEFF